ncbi:DUF805 domain-containing protein [Couchioplanes caeruleus]|uniref:DUF805 domain-containing protein n=1 Tax=Couchioplanes caeruleus TaxID=56438 RepID=UPI0020BFD286|nr:DUF805 domain-containing protein [Couchioplanes caeruleus]UQU61377.1 DUF805 domain-containing protein [Couchioplanes caeruleus]
MTVDSRPSVGPLGYWAGCYRKYATFSGRARRAEYWWFTLFNAVIYLALIAVGFLLGDSDGSNATLGILVAVFILVVFLPTLAVTCRRLHDAGLSGWWQLLGILPLGGFAVLIMTLLDSNDGPNKYGPDPR